MTALSFLLLVVMADDGKPSTSASTSIANDCGVNCLYIAMKTLSPSNTMDLATLQARLKPEQAGNSLGELSEVAREQGFQTLAVETSVEALQIRQRPFVFIAHLNRGHFVLLTDSSSESVTMVDPPQKMLIPATSLDSEWGGAGIIVSSTEIEEEDTVQRRLWWIRNRLKFALAMAAIPAIFVGTKLIYLRRRSP